jgi:hypothetical protein
LLVVGCWLLVVGCWLLVVGCWLLVVGYWLLVVGCWLLVVGCCYWLLVQGFVDNGYHFSTRVCKHDLKTLDVSEPKTVSCVAMGVGEGGSKTACVVPVFQVFRRREREEGVVSERESVCCTCVLHGPVEREQKKKEGS